MTNNRLSILWFTNTIENGVSKSFREELYERGNEFRKLGAHIYVITSRTYEEMGFVRESNFNTTPISQGESEDPLASVNSKRVNFGTSTTRSINASKYSKTFGNISYYQSNISYYQDSSQGNNLLLSLFYSSTSFSLFSFHRLFTYSCATSNEFPFFEKI